MSTIYDDYEVVEKPRRHRHHHHHHRDREIVTEVIRDDRTPRYTTTEETYVKKASPNPVTSEPQYVSRQTELIRRPVREDSDLAIEEVRRDFPPPGSESYYRQTAMGERRGSSRRARSVEREEYDAAYTRRSRADPGPRKGHSSLVIEEQVSRPRSLSRNRKIIAAVSGAALAVGGKELWDRRQAGGSPQDRNILGTAAVGAAGAFAGYEGAELYAKHGAKSEEKIRYHSAYRGKDGRPAELYYSSEDEVIVKPPKKSRRKSLVEGAMGLIGASGAMKALSGGGGGGDRDRDRDRRGGRDYDSNDSRSRSRTSKGEPAGTAKLQQAAKAALLAGAVEAFRVRKEPGGWGGAKAQRIITAAIGSGAVDAVADRNPDKHSKRHILEAVLGGLAANRAVNGSKREIEDDGRSRSRSRSRSKSRGGGGAGGGLAALATAAAAGLAGKKLLDNRSRSRSRRRRSPSTDSYDSRNPSPRGGRKDRHKRSKSVTDYARKGLAAIGLGEAVDSDRRSRDGDGTRGNRKSRYSDSDDDYDRRPRRGGGNRDRGDPYADSRNADSRSTLGGGGDPRRAKDGRKNRRAAEGKYNEDDGSSSDLGSSSGDEKTRKKMKGKQLLTAGLAGVATIHAAHNVYSSMEKRNARHKAVAEGKMSTEEARKLKAKATLQDVASIGIAALGIKGAISEWQEMQEMRHEYSEFCEKKAERHKKRMERLILNKQGNGEGGGRRRIDSRDSSQAVGYTRGYPDGRQYMDDNPYGALPHPPASPLDYGYGDR